MITDYHGERICGVPDHVGSANCMWPQPDRVVTVYAEGTVNGTRLADAAEFAIQGWNRACGIKMVMSTNGKTANIFTRTNKLDGPSNILAQCQLPCGAPANAQMLCDVDDSEAYVLAENPPQGKLDLGRVLRHEFGHGIGIGHIGNGNLMAPVYSAVIRDLKDGDIVECRARYGLPAPVTPTPTPTPDIPNIPGWQWPPKTIEFTDSMGRKLIYDLRT